MKLVMLSQKHLPKDFEEDIMKADNITFYEIHDDDRSFSSDLSFHKDEFINVRLSDAIKIFGTPHVALNDNLNMTIGFYGHVKDVDVSLEEESSSHISIEAELSSYDSVENEPIRFKIRRNNEYYTYHAVKKTVDDYFEHGLDKLSDEEINAAFGSFLSMSTGKTVLSKSIHNSCEILFETFVANAMPKYEYKAGLIKNFFEDLSSISAYEVNANTATNDIKIFTNMRYALDRIFFEAMIDESKGSRWIEDTAVGKVEAASREKEVTGFESMVSGCEDEEISHAFSRAFAGCESDEERELIQEKLLECLERIESNCRDALSAELRLLYIVDSPKEELENPRPSPSKVF